MRTYAPALCLLVCAMMLAPSMAAGQERTPTPSADELWRAYPLHERPEPSRTLTPTASSRPVKERPATDDGAPLPLIGAVGLLAALGGGLVLRRVRPRAPSLRRPQWAAPLLTTATAAAMLPRQRPRAPRLTALGDDRNRSSGDPLRPPDPHRAWTAEVQWSDTRFAVVARADEGDQGVSLATSRPLQWPPSGPEAVTAMSREVERLEASLLAAGWTPLPRGSAWYSKRFAWAATAPRPQRPAATAPRPQRPAPRPVTDPPRTETVPPSGRFKRRPEWPAGSEELWRCEIKWHPGYASSEFRAVAHRAKHHRGLTLGHSETFKWLLMTDPSASDPRFVAQVRGLADRLAAAGWERAGRGRDWFELRFVWRREGAPPEQLDPAPAEASR